MKTANADAGTNTWTLRLFTFLVWLVVGLCATYWAFKFVITKPVEATAGIVTPAVAVDTKAVAKLLGATDSIAVKPVITTASVKLTLFGLAASRNGQGVALIATEDKTAKPYRVGAQVTDDLVLKSISKADAVLAASISALDGQKLELPSRKPVTFVTVAAGAATPLFSQLPPPSIIPPDAIPEQPPVSISRDIAESGRRTNRIATRP
jgi:general secretion pathway protein C